MSSSLSSIILIGVVWLLILTTLFVRRHSPVRRTSKALSETRVVHEGGSGIERSRRRPLPAESLYHADQDSEIEFVEAEPEQVVIDDTREPVRPAVVEGEVVASYRALDDEDTGEFAPVRVAGRTDTPDATVAPDTAVGLPAEVLDGVDLDEEDDADTVDAADMADAVDVVDDAVDAEVAVDGAADTDETDTDEVDADEIDEDAEGVDDTEDGDANGTVGTVDAEVVELHPQFATVDTAYFRGGDVDITVGTDDELLPVGDGTVAGGTLSSVVADGTGSTAGHPDDTVEGYGTDAYGDDAYGDYDDGSTDDDVTDDDVTYVESRRGRGIYDPVASRALAEQRQRRRRRVLTGLVAFTVLSLVGALTLGGALWAVMVLGLALTGGYLYSLRKQTVAEQQLQHRRLARMRRARLGVRSTDDRELGVPDRLRRPGAVVLETDDADPEFAALGYADVTFAGVDTLDTVDTVDGVDYGTGYGEHYGDSYGGGHGDDRDDRRPTIRVV